MSQHTYDCARCGGHIEPGEAYTAYVLVSLEHRLVVEREHTDCEPPDDPWEDEWEDDAWEYPSESDSIPDISPKEPLPLAA